MNVCLCTWQYLDGYETLSLQTLHEKGIIFADFARKPQISANSVFCIYNLANEISL